ncbi:MAG: DUF1254 domain-containing protein [Cytophagales bacterium]|nr:MAG: DUF1254 domain-containing protein [Cytophagales bacterium]
MKKISLFFIVFFLALPLGYYSFLYFLPYYIMSEVARRKQLTYNQVYHQSLPTDASRAIVLPNPDFMYSIVLYDLSQKESLLIQSNLPDSSYWSVGFYDGNTSNYWVKNDQQLKSKKVKILLLLKGKHPPKDIDAANTEVVYAPTPKGIILTRLLVLDKKNLSYFDAIQKSFVIVP